MHSIDGTLPSVAIEIQNAIPLGKGLGSSAAASLLGLIIASRPHGKPLRRPDLAERACSLEGHPDNALAALYGGAVIATSFAARDCVKLGAPSDLHAVVVIPQIDLSTRAARALLPDAYARADTIFTAQRAALLGAALASGTWRALRSAMNDRVHQPYRAAAIPGLADALAIRSRDLLGVALSGAGPSVLAIVRTGGAWRSIADRLEACFERAGIAAQARHVAFSSQGTRVVATA